MKFVIDQDVYAATTGLLRGLGHDVVPVAQIGLSRADDEELLRLAKERGRVKRRPMFTTHSRVMFTTLADRVLVT